MFIYFLTSSVPLTKRFTKRVDGSITQENYLNSKSFTSHRAEVNTIEEFYHAVQAAVFTDKYRDFGEASIAAGRIQFNKQGVCLLKGQLNRRLVSESRAGSTSPYDATQWLCLDFDSINTDQTTSQANQAIIGTDLQHRHVEHLLKLLGLEGVSYVLQWSSSFGITTNEPRCHVYVMLDRPVAATQIKQWLIEKNLEIEELRTATQLTASRMYLHWALDITACQNDKLLYIAPPECIGFTDHLAPAERVKLVEGILPYYEFPKSVKSPEINKQETTQQIDMLRQQMGLPKKKYKTEFVGSVEVTKKVDSQLLSGVKKERGFVYFNLNGGDSWGYYHPEENPQIIYNFKGEPNYLTKELIPTYWAEITQKATSVSGNTTRLAITDGKSGAYLKITHTQHNAKTPYEEDIDDLHVVPAKSERHLRDFATQHGIALGDHIPEWEVIFDPKSETRVHYEHKVLNTFLPTKYMLAEPKTPLPVNYNPDQHDNPDNPNQPNQPLMGLPPVAKKIIDHVLGSDDRVTAHFLNWLAYIIQYRDQTRTAWVLQGVQGTGKGLLMNHIIRPLLGQTQTAIRLMHELVEPYNPWMRSCFVVFVDEYDTRGMRKKNAISAKLKSYITESKIPIRDMYQTPFETKNYTNWIMATNKIGAVVVESSDRRYNVGNYQKKKLEITSKELSILECELQHVYDFLYTWEIDMKAVHVPLETEARDNMVSCSDTTEENVVTALTNGDIMYFIKSLPTDKHREIDPMQMNITSGFKNILTETLIAIKENGHTTRLSRDELHMIFKYTVGVIPETPNRFTSYLRRLGIKTKQMYINGKNTMGFEIEWDKATNADELIATYLNAEAIAQSCVENIRSQQAPGTTPDPNSLFN